MNNVLEAKAPGGTHTDQRRRDNTATPVQDETPLAPAQQRGQDSVFPGALVQPRTDSNGDIINWARQHEFILSASDDPENAFPETPGTGLSSRVQHVLLFIAACESLADALRPEVVERLFEPGVSVAYQRVGGYGLRLARLPGVSQPERRYIRFRTKLIATLLDEPIEDGVTHSAEGLIDEALRADPSDCQNWLSQVLVEQYPTRPSLCASIVRCIGRLDHNRVRGWGMRVIDDALQNRDAEVRDAAICALEAWGGPAALDMLRRHQDAEAWLSEYVQQVIVDLSGTAS